MTNVAALGLSANQVMVVGGFFSLTFAVFLGSAIFFFISRMDVAPAYRMAVTISGVIVTIAGYHYFRIMQSFEKAVTGVRGFNEAYRYVDWVVTVPLLLTELVLVLSIAPERRRALLNKLVPYSFLMIVLGYPGEISDNATTQWIFWALSMVFFVLILATLFGELSTQIARRTRRSRAPCGAAHCPARDVELLPDRLPRTGAARRRGPRLRDRERRLRHRRHHGEGGLRPHDPPRRQGQDGAQHRRLTGTALQRRGRFGAPSVVSGRRGLGGWRRGDPGTGPVREGRPAGGPAAPRSGRRAYCAVRPPRA
jgi:hypothetical protein